MPEFAREHFWTISSHWRDIKKLLRHHSSLSIVKPTLYIISFITDLRMEFFFPLHVPLTSPILLHPIKHYKRIIRKKYQRGKYPIKYVLLQTSVGSLQHTIEPKRKDKSFRLATFIQPTNQGKPSTRENFFTQEETASCLVPTEHSHL